MSKGIAIRTILLLLVGTVVAAIIIYLVYTYTQTPGLSAQECRSRLISWCTGCMASATSPTSWSTSVYMASGFVTDCATKLGKIGISGITTSTTCYIARTVACAAVGIK